MEPKRRGLMLVLSSPSGAGKTTLARRLLDAEPGVEMSVSCTTRKQRNGEVEGRDYHFIDRETFAGMRDRGEFLEWAVVFDNYYGTPRKPVEEALAAGRDVLFDVDWQGAQSLRDNSPDDVVTVFILPPSGKALEHRLNERAQDAPDVVAARMRGASNEIQHWGEYDYVVINHDIDQALAAVRAILAAERLRCIAAHRAQGFRAEFAGRALAAKRVGDAAEIADLKLLGAALGIDAKPLQQLFCVRRDLAERGAQHLTPLAEGRCGHPLERRDVASRLRNLLRHELDERRVDLGPRGEGCGGKGQQNAGIGAPLAEHGEAAEVLAAWLGHDAERDLALKHEHQPVEPGRPGLGLEPADQERRGDAIGKVGDDAGRALHIEGAIVDLARVAGDNLEPPRIGRGDIAQARAGSARPSRWR